MTSNYNTPNFKIINQEICDSISTLKKHGINIEFNEDLRKRFDDYTNRPLYHVVEDFLPVLDKCGRQALFKVSPESKSLIDNEILISF